MTRWIQCLRLLTLAACAGVLIALPGFTQAADTPEITQFMLIDTDTDQQIPGYSFGPNTAATLNLSRLPENLTIQAIVNNGVDSIAFSVDPGIPRRFENHPPYSLTGDSSGNYHKWHTPMGQVRLSATPYSRNNGGGTEGPTVSVTFNITENSGPALDGFTLINTHTQQAITGMQSLGDGAIAEIDPADIPAFTLRADAAKPVGSVRFEVPELAFERIENHAPYAVSENGSGPYAPWDIPAGTYSITATPYSAPHLNGEAGESIQLTLHVKSNGNTGGGTDPNDFGRPRIEANTVVAADGSLLRGMTLQLEGPGHVFYDTVMNRDYWSRIADVGFNTVRLDVKLGNAKPNPRTIEQQLQVLDEVLQWAAEEEIYVALMTSTVPGHYDYQELRDFWTAAAPRYKDLEHVMYEMVNEPVAWHPYDYTQQHINDLFAVWQLMRNAAPDTHIILWDFASVPEGLDALETIRQMPGVDYSNTSIGFHWYHHTDDHDIGWLRAHYPVFMTETHNNEHMDTIAECEKLFVSWIHLYGKRPDGHDGMDFIEQTLLPDLRRRGYDFP